MGVCVARFAEADTSAPEHPCLRFVASSAQDPEMYTAVLDSIAHYVADAMKN